MTAFRRIHVTGASGAGTTTLGAALGRRLGLAHFDTDSFYWYPTDPPFREKRPEAERLALLREALAGADGWVLSGSLTPWGNELAPEFELVVFLVVPPEERLRRTRVRERERYGAAIDPGGAQHESYREFMAWSATYDTKLSDGRSLAGHRAWLATLACPVIELSGVPTVEESVAAVLAVDGPRTRHEFPFASA